MKAAKKDNKKNEQGGRRFLMNRKQKNEMKNTEPEIELEAGCVRNMMKDGKSISVRDDLKIVFWHFGICLQYLTIVNL